MTPERWQQVEELFHAALELETPARTAFLNRECKGDEELRAEVIALLSFEQQADSFIEKPILHDAAERLAENQAQSESAAFTANSKLGNYQILSLLGKGGMGEVYLARDLKLGREVAIKILPPEFAQDPDRVARFEREARMLSALNHPNIAAIYALEQSNKTSFIVLEYVPGETLAERLSSGPLPVAEALPILKQIAEALSAAHEKGIVHRDLKPANIKITPQGQVKVLDFGLAKASKHDLPTVGLSVVSSGLTTMTAKGMILGTVPYMSPEQTRGHEIDRRTDVWAFGCVSYETLAGTRPFNGATTADTMAAILSSEPNWRVLPKNVPNTVSSLIRNCLQKDYFTRLNELGEARNILDQALAVYSPLGTSLKRARWNARIALLAAAVVIIFASFVIWQVAHNRAKPNDLATMLTPKLKGDNLNWALSKLSFSGSANQIDESELSLDQTGNLNAINETIETLKARLANEPQSAHNLAMLSQAYYLKYCITLDNTDKENAVQACEKAVKIDSQLPEVQLALGNVLTALGRTDQGIEQFKAVLAKDPQNYEAILGSAVAYENKEQLANAENYYRQAINLRPQDWVGYNQLGHFYFAQGQYQDAANEWQKAASLASLNPVGLANLGSAYYALGKLDDAEKAYRDSLQIRFTTAAVTGLGIVFFERGDYKNAAIEFEKACEKTPEQLEVWGNYADALRAMGHKDDAVAAYDKAIKLVRKHLETDPNEANSITFLAECLAKRGDQQEALQQIERCLRLQGQARSLCLKSAVIVYALTNHRQEALQLLSEALSSELFNLQIFDNAPELAELRLDPEYKRVTQPYRNSN